MSFSADMPDWWSVTVMHHRVEGIEISEISRRIMVSPETLTLSALGSARLVGYAAEACFRSIIDEEGDPSHGAATA